MPDSVEEIGADAFNDTAIKTIVIPKKVKKILDHTFTFCSELTKVNFNNVEEIGEDAFSHSDKINNIYLGEKVKKVEENAIYGCLGLKRIYVGENVQNLGDYVFSYCKNLRGITVNENNKNYASVSGALYDKNLKTLLQYPLNKRAKTIKILNSVESINRLALIGLQNVEKFTVAKSNKVFKAINKDLYSIDGKKLVRYAVAKLDKVITIDNEVEEIGLFAFENAVNLEKVNILGGVKTIGFGAFKHCKSLTKVKIYEGVKKIDRIAFAYCDCLEKVYIPSTVEFIEKDAFEDCYDVKLYVKKGSYAHNYAKQNDIEYKLVK